MRRTLILTLLLLCLPIQGWGEEHQCHCGNGFYYTEGIRAIICPMCNAIWTKQYEKGFWYNRSDSEYAEEFVKGVERYGTHKTRKKGIKIKTTETRLKELEVRLEELEKRIQNAVWFDFSSPDVIYFK